MATPIKTRIEYQGFVILPGKERVGAEWIDCWRLTKNGANVAPGATWFRTEQDALRAADVMVVVDGDAQKWWALWRAITNPYRS